MIRNSEGFGLKLAGFQSLVDAHLIPGEPLLSEVEGISSTLKEKMRQAGLFGLSIPEEYGGSGLTFEEECLAMFVLGRASAAYRALYSLNVGSGSQGIVHYGTDAQRQRYLGRMASGELITAFALTEQDSGSDAASIRCAAVPDGDGFVLSGIKCYVGNAPEADVFIVLAKVVRQPGDAGPQGATAFIVDRATAGLVVGPSDPKLGLDGAHIASVTLSECRVGPEALLGEVGKGFRLAFRSLDKARLHVAAVCVGASERMLEDALAYACEREQFGSKIADFGMIQTMLADSRTEILAARALVIDVARRMDEGLPVSADVACAKLFASEMASRIADRALQIHGGAGYLKRTSIERFYRDVRVFRIIDGTSQIQQVIIARDMVKSYMTSHETKDLDDT